MGNLLSEEPSSGKPPLHRPFYSFSTFEILNILDTEFHKTITAIQNLKRSRDFSDNARAYVCQLMRDTEEIIHTFNLEMVGKRQGQHGFVDSQLMIQEIRKLKEDNNTLKALNKKLEHMLKEKGIEKSLREKGSDSKASTDVVPDVKGKPNSNKGGGEQRDENSQTKLENCMETIQVLQIKNESSQNFIELLQVQKDKLEQDNESLTTEKENLVTRLSKLAGQRLAENNPAIADLSDPNRPTKLGEVYSEIYDNEWTNAFEALEKAEYTEEEAIGTLRLTLVNVLEFCKSKSDALLKKTEDAVNFLFEEFQDFEEQKPLRHLNIKRSQSQQWLKEAHDSSFDGLEDEQIDLRERWKPKSGQNEGAQMQATVKVDKPEVDSQLKVFRKEVAQSMVPIVQKAYMSASWKDKEYIPEMYPFIKKCLFLGWMMMVQSPQMALATCEKGAEFDKNMFKEYTATGSKVLYVVWPALQLHENGPVVGKGVAQGQKDK